MTHAPESSRREQIHLVEYDAAWALDFAREATGIRRALSSCLIDLHHIGSTAIPGIVAKPIVDMLAVVSSVELVDAHTGDLESLGYEAKGEYDIPGRRYFRKHAPDGTRTHHLHAFALGSPHIARHLDFRDYLRAHPPIAEAYADLKRSLARGSVDTREYTEAKAEFVREIERKAAAWRLQLRQD